VTDGPGLPAPLLDRAAFELEVEDTFDGRDLRADLWLPAYLPQWSSRDAAAARYDVADGLRLRVDADQPPWNPEFDGELRVSSLQTGVFAGPTGSPIGQHRFRDGLVVREAQDPRALYTPRFGLVEARLRASDDPSTMVALWMIGYEDEPGQSAEICIAEIFGRDVFPDGAGVGMGVHPFEDRAIVDDFARELLPIDVREPHTYAAEWTPRFVAFYVDDRLVRVVDQSPAYPMQVMLGLYEFRDPSAIDARGYPKSVTVERFAGYRLRSEA
jgi:hypothetical protein